MLDGFHLEWKQDFSHFGSEIEIEIDCGCVAPARPPSCRAADADYARGGDHKPVHLMILHYDQPLEFLAIDLLGGNLLQLDYGWGREYSWHL